MHIGSQADVIREIPARMVRIVVDDDIVRVPEPAVAVPHVIGRNAPVPVVEPESPRAAAAQMPYMARAEAAAKAAMLPGMVQMKVRVVAAGVVADPRVTVD